MTAEAVPAPRPQPERAHYGAATVGGSIGGVLGASAAFLVALPFWPRGEDEAWAELGWAVLTLIACSVVGIAGGAAGVFRALRRQNAPDAGLTALVFVPAAALLAMGGPLVFAAPAAARWMAMGLRQWWDVRRDPGRVAPQIARGAGRPQRVVLWAVLTLLGMSLSVSAFNARFGGEIGGPARLWVLCSVVPVALLPLIWRAVPRWTVVALLLTALLLGAGMAVASTAGGHPSPERLAQIAGEIHPPKGQRVVARTSALAMRFPPQMVVSPGDPQPVEIIQSVPSGTEPSRLPPALTPDTDGFLLHDAAPAETFATDAGRAAAAGWERALRAAGWSAPDPPSSGRPDQMNWLPDPASEFLEQYGGPLLGRGLWERALVVPFGDGALVVFSTRP